MLWLCIALPRLPFEAFALDETGHIAVTLLDGRMRRILVGSRSIERLDFSPGMHLVTASTLCAALKSVERNPRAERKALERVGAWAYQWSSSVILHTANAKSLREWSCVWLEIAASFTLFGGRAELLAQIENELKKLGYEYRLGVAHTVEAAALLARANRRIVADTDAAMYRQLRTLPLDLLPLPEKTLGDMRQSGLRSIAELIQLPRDALARRFGPQVNEYFDKLLGLCPDPRPTFTLPKKYRAACELAAEVTSTEALLFPLRRMLDEFQGYLRAIDSGVQRFLVHLKHRDGITRIAIGTSAPERNSERFFELIRERFERVTLPQPVISIRLQADRFPAPTVKQAALFSGAQQSSEQFQQLLDKLIARLGEDAVHSYRLVADHRPEKAWRIAEPNERSTASAVRSPRPLWLLREPRRIQEPATLTTPERIEGGWWNNDDTRRDYFFVRTDEGIECWLYRDLHSNQWFLHGLGS